MASLETENKSLKSKNTRLKQQLAAEKKRADDLEKALEESQQKTHEGALELSAIWDNRDGIYRCSECSWEVVHGICQSCAEQFDYTADDEEREASFGLSHSVENESSSLDRVLSQRGTTPFLDIDSSRRLPLSLYDHISESMYIELLQRGATRLMIETFFLEYTDEKGIVAWADTELYEGFTLPSDPTNGDNTDTATEETTIKKGDYWKIYLGRRIVLDEDDYDGSQFIEGIIEDGILFTLLMERRGANERGVPNVEEDEEYEGDEEEDEGEEEEEEYEEDDEDDEEEEEEEEKEKEEEKEEDINKVIVWKTFLESPGIWATQPSFRVRDESTGPIVDAGYLTDHDHDESDQEDASMDLDLKNDDNDSKMVDVDVDEEEDSDEGWAQKANVPDRPWGESPESSPEPAPAPDTAMDRIAAGTGTAIGNVDADQEMASVEYGDDDDDSFDSDFDSQEEIEDDGRYW